MGGDDSDVSAITLSDDDEPKQKVSAPPKPAPKAAAGAVGSSRAAAAGGSKPAGKGERRKGRVAFSLEDDADYAEDDDGDAAASNGAAGRNRGYGDGDAADVDDGAVEDETKPLGWSYFRKRDASEGPATWDEVDVSELRFVAENLVRSTTHRASQADNVMQQIFQAAPGDEDSLVPDPLGRGVIDPLTLTLGKRSKMKAAARLAQPSSGEKGLKATMRTFHTSRLGSRQQQQQPGGAEGAAGGSQQPAAAAGSGLDEDARKVLPNQEGFDPEAYLAAFHSESSMSQLDKGLRSLSRELSERTGQLKLLIRNNFERFINCKDAIDDIHGKMRKTLVRGGGGGGGGGTSAGGGGGGAASPAPPASGPSAAAATAAQQQQQQQQTIATDRVFRSLEQVEGQARRTFGPILDRAAKADRIRAVASLLQRFDHLFAAPQRVMELASRGELEQVVREYKRANMLIKPTPTTARVWVSLYAEIEKRVTEVYLAVKQLVTEPPPPEERPMGQDGPVVLFGAMPTAAAATSFDAGAASGDDDASRQRLSLLPDYLLFLALVRQERLPAAREEDAMRLYISRLETHVVARIQDCDKQHTEQLGQLVASWMRSSQLGAATTAGGGGGGTTTAAAAALRAAANGIAALQASFTALPRLDAPGGGAGAPAAANGQGEGRGTKARGGGGEGERDRSTGKKEEEEEEEEEGHLEASEGEEEEEGDDELDDEGETAEVAFLQWHGGLASVPSSAFLGKSTASLPYHIRTELRRLVQEPGGPYGAGGLAMGLQQGGGGGRGATVAGAAEPLPSSAHAPQPQLTPAQRQWVSYVCSVSALLLWSLPGLWATCSSAKYGNNADLSDESREGLERGPSLARRLVEGLCAKYAARLRRAAQSLARAGPMQPGLPLIIKDACHLWSSLRRVGIGTRPLSGLRSAVLGALAADVRVLADHLAELPQLLFGADDFRLDLLAADQQPVTSLPRRLEEEVGVALLHYQWPLAAVVEAAGGVGDVPAESSWRPVQGSVLACFSLLSEALAEYARGLYASHHGDGGRGTSNSFRSKPSGSMSTDLESLSSVVSAGSLAPPPPPALPGSSYRRAAARASGAGSPRRMMETPEDGGSTQGSLWSATGGGGGSSDDVRVLLVIGNSAVIRTRVMPGVVERYRKLLAPTSEAAATCQRRLRELTSGMRRSNEALGSSYLERKEADVQAAVGRYMDVATAPLLPAAAAAGGGGGGAAAGTSSSKRSARAAAGPAAAAAGGGGGVDGLLPGPSGPSAGCCSLLQLLTAIHNEALAYSPSNLRSFMEALAERLVGELAPACTGLVSAAAAAGSGGGGAKAGGAAAAAAASVEQLVQLWADLRFMTAALRPLLSAALAADLWEAQVDVAAAIAARQRARRYRPASVPAAALTDLNDDEAVSDALEQLLAADVDSWLGRHALNVRCFAAATAAAAAAAPAGSAAGGASAAGGKGARDGGGEASASPRGRREPGGVGDGGAAAGRSRQAGSRSVTAAAGKG